VSSGLSWRLMLPGSTRLTSRTSTR
jgi:hypothetical protein